MAFFQKRVTEQPQGFGEQLFALRELRHVSREELARRSGIHALMIQAFEEERMDELKDPGYAMRHIERLVRELDGRVPYFLQLYRQALEKSGVNTSRAALLHPRVRRRDLFVGSRLVVVAGFLLLLVLVGGYVAWHVHTVTSPPVLMVKDPPEGLRVEEPKIFISGVTEPQAFVKVNDREVIVDSIGQFGLELEIPTGFSTVRFEARRRNGVPVFLERHVTYERVTSSTRP